MNNTLTLNYRMIPPKYSTWFSRIGKLQVLIRVAFMVLAIMIAFPRPLVAQTATEKKELFDNAQFFFDSEDYQEALFYYLKLHEINPQNGNFDFQIGMCYINLPGSEPMGIPYFEQAIDKISYKYKKSEYEQTRAPLHTYFYLAQAYRMNNQLDKALDMLDKFTKSKYFEGNYNLGMVNDEIEACKRAKIIQDKPIQITIENLGKTINNEVDNYDPVFNGDQHILIYMTNLKFYNALFMTSLTDTGWSEPENITPQIGSDGDCYPSCLSADGKTLYLIKKAKNNNDLFVSHYENNKWSMMQPLNNNINSNKKETHACLSPDGNTLYFASDRKGTLGGLDIWYSSKQADGQWGKPVNMGSQVNSKSNEDIPFICNHGTTLIFASQGHQNMGGYDIFVSRLKNKEWGAAINIGYPINTTSDDTYYFPIGDGTEGYVAKKREGGFGLLDIYKITITGGDILKDMKE